MRMAKAERQVPELPALKLQLNVGAVKTAAHFARPDFALPNREHLHRLRRR